MVKINGKIIIEMHEWHNVLVRRPQYNETIVEPEEGDSTDAILTATQQAIDRVTPYVMNCPIGNWTGRATTYITIQPIRGQQREDFAERIKTELHAHTACWLRDSDFDGRIQLIVYTPSPMDHIRPAEKNPFMFDDY